MENDDDLPRVSPPVVAQGRLDLPRKPQPERSLRPRQTKKRVTWRAPLMSENFEVIADAAVAAMFWVDGRIEATDSAKVLIDENLVIASRKFKAQFRRELTERGFDVWPKHREKRRRAIAHAERAT